MRALLRVGVGAFVVVACCYAAFFVVMVALGLFFGLAGVP